MMTFIVRLAQALFTKLFGKRPPPEKPVDIPRGTRV